MNINYKYKYWDDEDCDLYVKNNFNDIYNIYTNLVSGAFKADIFRLCVIYKEGGI